MKRRDDWERRLNEYLADVRELPFAWGSHDCVLFAMGAVEAMTGDDPGAPFRGQYDDREGAARALREIGRGTLLRTVDKHFSRVPVGLAQRGDLVQWGSSVGVCYGAIGLFVGEERAEGDTAPRREGLVTLPRADWKRAWTV